MDLKSRGRMGRSFMHRAVRRVTRDESKSTISNSNAEDAELTKKVEALFSQELLFERLHTEPKWKRAYATTAKTVKHTATFVKKQKFATKAVAVALLVTLLGTTIQLSRRSSKNTANKPEITSVAGANTPDTKVDPSTGTKLPVEAPSFTMIKPIGKKYDDLQIVKVSPAGNDPVYAFKDTIGEAQVNVSEQKVPKTFDYNRDVELQRVAKDFQATDVIQIDSIKVYHGLNEKTKAQSLIFIKDDLLVFIKSTKKLSDDQWTGYVLSLQQY